ncbi:MAG: site-specific integrase [Clostridia bacterium]|nr:site-specific integrase [Clostridia bacterium]
MAKRGENITKRKDGRWEARVIYGRREDGKALYRYFYGRTYSEAKEKRQKFLLKENIKPRRNKESAALFDNILTDFLLREKYCVKESTYTRYTGIVNGHLRPFFGEMMASDITGKVVEAFINEKIEKGRLDGKGGLSPKRVRDILSVLTLALKYAREQNVDMVGDISFSKPRQNKKDVEIFSHEEEKILVSFMRQEKSVQHFGVLLSLFTGMRIGEICALRWGAIDLQNAIIHVGGTLLRIPDTGGGEAKTKILLDTPKTASSERDIPIPYGLIPELREYRRGHLDEDYFLTGNAHPLEPSNLYVKYRRWLGMAGIAHHSFHALRHTFATRCIENGFDAKSLSEILGHAGVKITLDRYVHSSMELKRQNMERLPIYLETDEKRSKERAKKK